MDLMTCRTRRDRRRALRRRRLAVLAATGLEHRRADGAATGGSLGAPEIGPADPALTAEYQQKIIDVIKTVYDPEIPVDIYELGLIYEIIVDANHRALIKMTLTSPACPSAQQIPQEVRYKVKAVPGITDAWVEIVWEPTWTKDLMSEAAKLTLGFFLRVVMIVSDSRS